MKSRSSTHWCQNFNEFVKFIYSEKATKFCEIFPLLLTACTVLSQKQGEDFAKFCGLLRIYELYSVMIVSFFELNLVDKYWKIFTTLHNMLLLGLV